MFFLDLENRPIVVPEEDRKLYNLFFASLSMIIGNSIGVSYLFSRTQNVFSRHNNKRNRIINDQSFLGVNFMHWFTKLWFLFGIFAEELMGSAFIINFMLPSLLLIIVLYLDSWKSLILIVKKRRWKIQLLHLLTIGVLTFVLSRIDIVNYKSIDETMLVKNPSIDVPSSIYQYDNNDNYYYDNLIFKMNFVTKTEVGLFNSYNGNIELNDVYRYIKEWEDYVPEMHQSRMSLRLRADKNLPIKYIKQFELKVLTASQLSIIYEIANEDEISSRFFNRELKHRISHSLIKELPMLEGEPPRIPFIDFYNKLKFQDTLSLNISNRIEIENVEVPLNRLSKTLKNHINKSTVIEYIYNDSTTYQDYINVLSAHKIAVRELRNTENYDEIDASIRLNRFSYDKKLYEERNRIRLLYPINITERFE
ncbi:hypothetical protein HNV08_13195 [Winogradskyella eckloniae]|uniref:hypothetical protein n=1 Tax=Winogradskyella eckloniae TaxID=1089306 RepID=UPI001565A4DA|nr:hypothetical protein [Winogradskyella eckloniae]NRD21006.1 hypothetical protein [Winogradskyella eckloniae]